MQKKYKDYESMLLMMFFLAMAALLTYVKYRAYMNRFPNAEWWTFFFK